MLNILVPTDFSICARNALKTAVIFATKTGATIHLLHIVETKNRFKGRNLDEETIAKENTQETENALTLLHALTQSFPKAKYEVKVVSGSVIEAIEKYLEETTIDLIVLGSHGKGTRSNLFIGSNAQKIVRKIKTLTLVVKSELNSIELKNVVFASSFNRDEKFAINTFLKFIKPFAPKVHLVHINIDLFYGLPGSIIQDVLERAKEEFEPLEVEIHQYRDYTVEDGIEHMASIIGAELIAVVNSETNPIKRLFKGSTVEALINHAEVPVLSIGR